MNVREKLVADNIIRIKPHIEQLTEWEREFVLDIIENFWDGKLGTLSQGQFNKLHEISQDVRLRGW